MLDSLVIVTSFFAYRRRPLSYQAGAEVPDPLAKVTVTPSFVTDSALDKVKSIAIILPAKSTAVKRENNFLMMF